MARRSFLVLVGSALLFAAVLVGHNRHLFDRPVYEDGDHAANSLLVLRAKRLELLHGHYSRHNFHHPGPAGLYVMAAAEGVLHDRLGAVPAPHNAHILGQLLLNAFLLGVVVAVVSRSGGRLAGAAALVVLLGYFARYGDPVWQHWPAYPAFPIALALMVSAASVAAGRLTHLGWLALAGGLAVHNNVSVVPFAVLVAGYALACAAVRGGLRLGALTGRERRAWVIFAAVAGVFLLPIVLHAWRHFPGEVGKYIAYGRSKAAGGHSLDAVGDYMVRTLTADSPLGGWLVLGVAGGAAGAVLTGGPGRRFAAQLGAVGLVACGAMFLYVRRGLDDLSLTYAGLHFGAVLLVWGLVVVVRVAARLRCRPQLRAAAVAVLAAVGAWAAVSGQFANRYPGMPEAPALAEAVLADPRWADGPPALTLDHDVWPETAAVLLQLERRGYRPWVVYRYYDLIFTDAFRPVGVPPPFWQLDVGPRNDAPGRVRRVVAEAGRISVRELDTRLRPGEPTPVGFWSRPGAAKPLAGWHPTWSGDEWRSGGGEATVLLDTGGPLTGDHRLTVRAWGLCDHPSRPQRVRVAVNGEPVGLMVFPSVVPVDQAVVVPAAALARSPAVVTFTFLDYWSARRRWFHGEVPHTSVHVSSLELTPVGG
ncbi:MAG: hypothetical protein C0501_05550 [Isosphaera sp.]|nr:hypothetical protein [Isosphaera sp.]